ncbi:uncharacterized protein N7498_000014 [Penicillium cinerascens]|uniref:Enoyl-CoA hydratase/isomerase family protein n=1 Tax=Penicillium cinerascens TaxID=70096 RepID=A0A9W9NDL8_9EURO|nr:uncharacterized protein N7498_000014 [Penicillium cinerascens]KAJ5217915.1 hypothetical protein N7498_000014 [Penicillium cinerascens]
MAENGRILTIPETYVTAPHSPIRITNYPEWSLEKTPIQIVKFNRPKKLNSITEDMIDTLQGFFTTVNLDDEVKVIILTGTGKTFSAGIDLNMDLSHGRQVPANELRDPGGTLALSMFNCSKPIIVAYNGLAVGIGMTSTLAAAIRIASEDSEFGFPFARIGLTMESCSSFFLPRMVGYSNATYLLATGKRFPAKSSVLHGVFAEIVPTAKDVLPRAIEIAEDILRNVSTMAIHLNRQLIWRNPGSAEKAHLVDSPVLYDMFAGKDHLEFKKAFFNKSAPIFTDVLSKNPPRTYPWWTTLSVEGRSKAHDAAGSKL